MKNFEASIQTLCWLCVVNPQRPDSVQVKKGQGHVKEKSRSKVQVKPILFLEDKVKELSHKTKDKVYKYNVYVNTKPKRQKYKNLLQKH